MNAQTPFNPEADFDPTVDPYYVSNDDIRRAAGDFQSETRVRVNQGLAADPDDAAEAVKLADITNEPAPWVMQNLDERKEQVRQATAQQLVLSNPALVSYLQSHPMAASVSNDDWANLDAASESSSKLAALHRVLNAPFEKIGEAELEGIQSGWQGADISPEYAKATDPTQNQFGLVGALAASATYGTANLLLKTMGAIFGGVAGAAKGVGTAVGGEGLGREAQAITEYEMMRGDQPLHGEGADVPQARAPAKPSPLVEAMGKAAPWMEAGIEPPAGLHPLIDQAKAQMNEGALALMDEVLQNVQASTTRERSAELMKGFLDQFHKDATFEIHSDAALNLYGDKPPAPDDGLLGWVPDIDTQLAAARDIGQGVSVKISDWLTHVEPEVAKTLHDDIRMWLGGITAREAAEPPVEPKAIVDAPLPQVRDVAGLEPKFAMGDRKLELSLREKLPATDFVGTELPEAHNYDMLDENGQPVGDMQIIPSKNKELYVNWIGGNAGMFSNTFGPSLIRDIKRQLKVIYPDYDTLTGYRVSGAREQAGANALAKVKLSVPDLVESLNDHEAMQEIFQNGWRRFNERVETNPQPASFYTQEQLAEGKAVQDEIQRIAPGVDVQGTAGMRRTGTNQQVRGLYQAYADRPPTILHDMLGPDQVGVGRHEVIHYLKDNGFFTSPEWSALEVGAKSEGWLDRYNIHERYAHLDDEDKLEESVVEAFREWAGQAPEVRPKTGVGAIFQKLWDFLDRVRQRMGEALGRTPTWEEVFQRVHSGEVGRRGPGEPEREGAFDLREKYAIEGDDNLRAQAVGLPVDSFKKLQDGYRKRNAEDLEAAIARNKKIEERNQSKEWRANRADMAKEVAGEIRQRPDIAADAFVGSGELGGQKLQQRYTLRTEDFTPEQRTAMPEHYTSKDGLPADQVAGMFGYGSKDELASALAGVHALRTTAEGDRMGRGDFLRQLVQTETDRRMEARYGDRDANVMDAAIDRALSQTNINVMHQDYMAAAQQGGVTAFNKDVMQAAAKRLVDETTIGKASSYRLMQEMGRASRVVEKALLDKDFAGATQAMQRQTLTAMVAKEIRAAEKEIKTADRMFKTNAARERPSIEPENMNWAHSIMLQIGKPVKRTTADLAREIEATGTTTLQDFVTSAQGRLQIMPVWDQLYDKTWSKPYKDLTVQEFRHVRDSVKTIIANGRDERKLIAQGNAIDLKEGVKQLADALKQFETLSADKIEVKSAVGKAIHIGYARTLQIENIFDRWDRWDPKGPWSQMVFRDVIDSANQSDAWRKETARKLRALDDKVDLKETVPYSPFVEPKEYGGRQIPATRETLRVAMLNIGTESNLAKFAKGWGLDPQMIENWIHTHADEKDWKFVRGVWDVFNELKERSDTMYRSMSEVPAESIDGRTIASPRFGNIKGGYYPLFRHEIYAPAAPKSVGELMGEGFESATPAAAYTKSRTQAIYPVALNMNRMANRMVQMIHDTAVRPAVVNANKIFRDPLVKGAIVSRYGKEYHDMANDWVKGIANASNSVQKEGAWLQGFSDFMRTNIMSGLIGFNPGTWAKHGLTAGGLSIKEAGVREFTSAFGETTPDHIRAAMHSLFNVNDATADGEYNFAMNSSLELQRRERNAQESIYNASTELIRPRNFWGRWRDVLIEKGSGPIAFSDKLSAVPTWLAKYREQMAAGEAHGDAVAAADKAVRRAHGSTSIAARPLIMQSLSPWLTTFYNFFNDVFNRQVETLWRSGEMVKLAKDGQHDAAMRQAKLVAAGLFVYAVWPALTESLVSPEEHDPNDGWAKRAGKAIFRTEGATLPVVRDIANGMLQAKDPDVGLFSTEYKGLTDLLRDLDKKAPLSPPHAEKMLRDGGELLGVLAGVPEQIARTVSGAYGYAAGVEHPRGPWGWGVLGRYGTTKGHSQTLEDYMAGRSSPNR